MNLERLNKQLERMGDIGRCPDGGVTRLAYTDEDMEARTYLKSSMRELGLHVSEDAIGNILGTWPGTDPSLAKVVVGSHIDTVPSGGMYDGVLGVLGALECIHSLQETGFCPTRTIDVIAFAAEESSRFNISTIGSKSLLHPMHRQELEQYRDKDNLSLHDVLITRGYEPEKLARWEPSTISAFLELHIEQGPLLEQQEIDIGIVKTVAAPTRLRIMLHGEAAHSGSCPMASRKDALAAAAHVIAHVESAAIEESHSGTVATVGRIEVFPGSMNVVPEEVSVYIDVRGIDIESIDRTVRSITDHSARIAQSRNLGHAIERISREIPVQLDPRIMGIVEQSCVSLGRSHIRMTSGAGHDIMNIARIAPSALIFVPCVKGISHSKQEKVLPRDIANGVEVLQECLRRLSM